MDNYIITLTETEARSKSNTHQLNELKQEIKELKSDQTAIYDIATSVKLIAQDMGNIKEDMSALKQGQNDFSDKVDLQIKEVKLEQDELGTKIAFVDNKSKVDFIDYVKENFWKLLVSIIGLSGFGYIVYYLTNLT